MRRIKFLLLIISFVTIVAMSSSCEKNNNSVEPTISLKLEQTTETSITVSVSVQDVTSIKYLINEGTELNTDASEILSTGTPFDFNTQQNLTIENLNSNTTYTIAVAGENNGTLSQVKSLQATTSESIPEPTVSVEIIDSTYNSLTFSITSTNGEQGKYIIIKKDSRDIAIDDVFNHGEEYQVNTTIEITAEGLESETEYEIFAAIHNKSYSAIASADASTPREIRSYIVNATTASSQNYSSNDYQNYYVTFTDPESGHSINVDFYNEADSKYLATGTYSLSSVAPGYASLSYTTFRMTPTDTLTRFSEGEIDVVANANEETGEVTYSITGNMVLAVTGDLVSLEYEGIIDGIEIPEDNPIDGAYHFIPDESTKKPERINVNNEVPGEYYIKFYNSNWDELTLDIFIDPTICNDGKDGLPEGTYSTDDETINPESSRITLYSPYFSGNFTECTLEVSVSGDEYTFILNGTATSSSGDSKQIYLNWTGVVENMVR